MYLEVMRWKFVISAATKSEEEHEDALFVNYGKQSL